ncbi:hypothetical protein [Acrocarpospora catenulata]|uniref:hypothetical protein n=1 Tax=Acrocarpospora catenulata TaxID=2836182 RepID=UPI001BD927EE|nr:hypothetical protein [Acrocarpospora catenulata]
MSEMHSLDTSEADPADVVEQNRTLREDERERTVWSLEIPLEADPADTAEQRRVVEQDDEDDYR